MPVGKGILIILSLRFLLGDTASKILCKITIKKYVFKLLTFKVVIAWVLKNLRLRELCLSLAYFVVESVSNLKCIMEV